MPKIIFDTGRLYDLYIACGGQICTDTRKLLPGSMFVALKGPNFNANSFAAQALEQGCSYAVIDEPELAGNDPRFFVVPDALQALQQLATIHRRSLGLKVLAIGGSNGKTTTKELVYRVLSMHFNTIHTQGNLNNHIGVPLTLLSVKAGTEMAVVEMGANHIGEMAELSVVAEPDFGIITNIGKEHLEGFGSIEGVARGESELYDYLQKTGGFAFVNNDDPWLRNMAVRLQKKLTYGFRIPADFTCSAERYNPEIIFTLNSLRVHTHLSGDYNFQNIVAACAIGTYFNIPPQDIKTAIESYVPENNRSQVIRTSKNTLFLDAYNANPSSMEASLNNFATFENPKKLAILGDMFELGEHAPQEHRAMVAYCKEKGLQEVLFAGPLFFECEMPAGYHAFKDTDDLKAYLKDAGISGYDVLLKGSRGMRMETMAELL